MWRRVEQHGVVGVRTRVGVEGGSWVGWVSRLRKQGAGILALQRRHPLETCEHNGAKLLYSVPVYLPHSWNSFILISRRCHYLPCEGQGGPVRQARSPLRLPPPGCRDQPDLEDQKDSTRVRRHQHSNLHQAERRNTNLSDLTGRSSAGLFSSWR